MRVLILLSLLGVALAAPQVAPRNGRRIIGGDPTNIDQYPFMSNMQYFWFGITWTQTCGGTLLNSQTVVSGAHCYYGDSADPWRVVLGSSFVSSGGSIHPAQSILLHPEYNDDTLDHDVALIRLAVPAVFSNNVAPARIAGPNYNLADNTVVTIIGWGSLTEGNGPYPEQLQRVDINIINQEYCAERYVYLKSQPGYQNWPEVTDNMLCAGIQQIGGKAGCQGDTGGPLLHANDVLVGIISWSYGCAYPDYPGVNTRVSRYTDWIVDNS